LHQIFGFLLFLPPALGGRNFVALAPSPPPFFVFGCQLYGGKQKTNTHDISTCRDRSYHTFQCCFRTVIICAPCYVCASRYAYASLERAQIVFVCSACVKPNTAGRNDTRVHRRDVRFCYLSIIISLLSNFVTEMLYFRRCTIGKRTIIIILGIVAVIHYSHISDTRCAD